MAYEIKNNKLVSLSKKAAMFGLDARIALAIFGALSVITGVALYQVLEKVKIVSYQTQIEEISKAISQYMLDTRKDLPKYTALGVTNVDFRELFSSSVKGWKGPYLKGKYTNTQFNLSNSTANHFKIKQATTTIWTAPESGVDVGNGECGTPCYYWIEMGVVDGNEATMLDKSYDITKDDSKGMFRVFRASPTLSACYYRIMPVMNQ